MARHRPVDARMIETFWRGVERAGVTGRELAAHTGLDESAISRMRSIQTPTPLDVALHSVDLTGARPLIAPLAKVGLKVTETCAPPSLGLMDSSLGLVESGAALVRSVRVVESVGCRGEQRRRVLEYLDEMSMLIEQARAAILQEERACS